jgi:hypothetical protein
MREKRETPTIDMCYYRGVRKSQPCSHPPLWRLKGEKYRFKVCDEHLAWGIRLSGMPALVEKFEPDLAKRLEQELREDSTEQIKFLPGPKETLK